MELYIKILADYYAKHGYLDQLVDPTAIVQDRCYQALCRIREILEDDTLEDPECFLKIEEIVCVLEELGSDAGLRHDFGKNRPGGILRGEYYFNQIPAFFSSSGTLASQPRAMMCTPWQ